MVEITVHKARNHHHHNQSSFDLFVLDNRHGQINITCTGITLTPTCQILYFLLPYTKPPKLLFLLSLPHLLLSSFFHRPYFCCSFTSYSIYVISWFPDYVITSVAVYVVDSFHTGFSWYWSLLLLVTLEFFRSLMLNSINLVLTQLVTSKVPFRIKLFASVPFHHSR